MRFLKYNTTITLFCLVVNFSKAQSDLEKVTSLLHEQQACWNNGDIPCFMKHYWKSDSLTFVGKSGIQYGWDKTLENYQKSYPDKNAMGQLAFDIVKVSQLADDAIYMLGKWSLKRKNDSPNGLFTLIFKKINGQWLIVSDHSS
jgi:ketosteroid isomerase-like protein